MRWACGDQCRALCLLMVLALGLAGCRSPISLVPELDQKAVAAERELQREGFLLAEEARAARLRNVAFPLLETASELFPGAARAAIGVATMRANDIDEPYRDTASRLFALSEAPVVRAVVPGSPADRAGFLPEDLLVAIGGEAEDADVATVLDRLRDGLRLNETLTVAVRRNGDAVWINVKPASLAPYDVRLMYRAAINAQATGKTIEVNLGMIEFCENDTELAFVVAHELAHNALRHHRDFVINYLLGTAADIALLALSVPSANVLGLTALYQPSESYEAEADYVALYLLARCGYDLGELRGFWRRMALLGPERRASRHSLWTHPEPAERQVLLEHAIAEIAERLEAGLPLEPPRRR